MKFLNPVIYATCLILSGCVNPAAMILNERALPEAEWSIPEKRIVGQRHRLLKQMYVFRFEDSSETYVDDDLHDSALLLATVPRGSTIEIRDMFLKYNSVDGSGTWERHFWGSVSLEGRSKAIGFSCQYIEMAAPPGIALDPSFVARM